MDEYETRAFHEVPIGDFRIYFNAFNEAYYVEKRVIQQKTTGFLWWKKTHFEVEWQILDELGYTAAQLINLTVQCTSYRFGGNKIARFKTLEDARAFARKVISKDHPVYYSV